MLSLILNPGKFFFFLIEEQRLNNYKIDQKLEKFLGITTLV